MMVERPVAPQSRTPVPPPAPAPAPPLALPPIADHAPSMSPSPSPTPLPGPHPTSDRAHTTLDRVGRWQATHDLARLRAETERVKVLVDFLARPVCAPGGAEPDPDIVTAYNLAVEAALNGIRRAAQVLPV